MKDEKIVDFKCGLCGAINNPYLTYEVRNYDQEIYRDCWKCHKPQLIFIPKPISLK